MKFEVTLVGQITVVPETPDEVFDRDEIIEGVFDETMEELTKLSNIEDPQVSGRISDGFVEVSIVVEADGYGPAVTIADPAIRAAFHAAGARTEDWDGRVRADLHVVCINAEETHLIDA